MKTGTEWLIDAAGCDPALLADLGSMRALCEAIVSVHRTRTPRERPSEPMLAARS